MALYTYTARFETKSGDIKKVVFVADTFHQAALLATQYEHPPDQTDWILTEINCLGQVLLF